MQDSGFRSPRKALLAVALATIALVSTGCARSGPGAGAGGGSRGTGPGAPLVGTQDDDLRPSSLLATHPRIDKAFNAVLLRFRWAKTALPKLDRVSATLFRGGQPRPSDGFAELARLGVRTVVNLRLEDNGEGPSVEAAGMRAVYIPMPDTAAPTAAQVREFRAVLADPASQPVYVHCASGTFRTSTMVAIALIDAGANAEQALADAKRHGWNSKMGDAHLEERFMRDYAARPQAYR